MSIEAMELALEALKFVNQTGDTQTFDMCYADKAITAIENALAQPKKPEQDYPENFIHALAFHTVISDLDPEQEQGEPVAVVTGVYGGRFIVEPANSAMVLPVNMALYAHPQPRKPLTRRQIREIEVDVSLNPSFDYITPAEQLCRAIEAAHGIKE